jgi:preprotein translocase subunit YajC
LFAPLSSILLTAAEIIAQAPPTTAPTTQPGQPGWTAFFKNPMVFPIIVLIFLYFFIFRSKRKQERQKQDLLSQIKRGDRVQTIGGILGKVVDVEERKVLLKVDESSNTKIWFSRNAVHRVLPTDEEKAEAGK